MGVRIIRPQQKIYHIPTMGIQTIEAQASGAALDWWVAGGTILEADCLEHVELPAQGQLYAGAAVAGGSPWTIAVVTESTSLDLYTYVFDSLTGRVILGSNLADPGQWYATDAGWRDVGLWSGLTSYFLVSDGAAIQAYRSGVAVGASGASNEGIGGATRWRSHNAGALYKWPAAVPRAAVYKIAVAGAQLAALHNSMMA